MSSNGTALIRTEPGILNTATAEGWDLVARKAESLAGSSIIPREYQGNAANVLVAMEMADRTGVPVLAVMQNLNVINGRPSWSAQFLIAAVNRSGRFSPLRFRFEGTEGEDSWGCRAVAVDLGDSEELIGTLVTTGMAKAEGWATKSGSKWKTMPEQMLRYRAAAFWARTHCPELTVGLHTAEEAEDIGPTTSYRKAALAEQLDGGDPPEAIEAEELEEAEPKATADGELPLGDHHTRPTAQLEGH